MMDMTKSFLVWNERKQPFLYKNFNRALAFLRTEFAMESNERFWSIVAPKYFTDSLASIGWPLQETLSLDWDFNLCFEPNKTDSVLPRCRDNLLQISQSLTHYCFQFCNIWLSDKYPVKGTDLLLYIITLIFKNLK